MLAAAPVTGAAVPCQGKLPSTKTHACETCIHLADFGQPAGKCHPIWELAVLCSLQLDLRQQGDHLSLVFCGASCGTSKDKFFAGFTFSESSMYQVHRFAPATVHTRCASSTVFLCLALAAEETNM